MGEFADGHTSLTKIESSIESGKFLKLSSQVLDIGVHLNSTFRVDYFELNSEIRRKTSRVNLTSRVFLSSSNSKTSSSALPKKLTHGCWPSGTSLLGRNVSSAPSQKYCQCLLKRPTEPSSIRCLDELRVNFDLVKNLISGPLRRGCQDEEEAGDRHRRLEDQRPESAAARPGL